MDNSLQICVCMCVFPACWRETAVTSCHVSKAVMDKPGLFLHFSCQRVPHCLLETNSIPSLRNNLWSALFELMITFEFVIGCNQCQCDDSMGTVKRNVKSPNDSFSSSLCLVFTWSPPLMSVWDVPFPYGWICQYQSYKSMCGGVAECVSGAVVYLWVCQRMSAVRDASCLYCF